MTTIQLEIDDYLAALLRSQEKPPQTYALELIVLELYRRGEISSGKAAELLDVGRMDFIRHASSLGIPYFNLTPDELDREVAQYVLQLAGESP